MFGLCLYKPQKEGNFSSLLRTAYNFDCDFICTVENRYHRLKADTVNCRKHIPIFHFPNWDSFLTIYPKECALISLEVNNSIDLKKFSHPRNAIYIFGPEKGSLPDFILNATSKVAIDTNRCLNLAICGGIVMYDRQLKAK
jgi:tRNA(Leu) C34 or U34 (ribose-2'-O)-methylase TrmL